MMTEQLHQEVSSVLNFRRDFEWMNKNFGKIEINLRESDLRSAHDGSVESWLLNDVEIDLDAEGILDGCAIESKGTYNGNPKSCFVCAFICSQIIYHYEMGCRIKELKDRKRSIMEYAEELKLVGDLIHSDQGFMGTTQDAKWGRTSLMGSDSRPLAIKPQFEYVIRLPDDHAVSLVVGIGMGGPGKMFMLQHIFDRRQDRFEKSISLFVSQTYSLKKLQAALALKIDLNGVVKGRVDEVQATELIHDC